jgi:hypothetical protein
MAKMYSYRIRIDAGSAPNPFWGLCTLVICKPSIRRVAKEGDWIVGTGSSQSPIGDASRQLVYAMRVSRKLRMHDYDAFVREHCPNKIPNWTDPDPRRRLGDAIYDFSSNPPRLRRSVHGEDDRKRDLSGMYALVSDHFFYFGDCPIPLPAHLLDIAAVQRGHRSDQNVQLFEPFVVWLNGLGLTPNQLMGAPQKRLFDDSDIEFACPQACGPVIRRTNRVTGSCTEPATTELAQSQISRCRR